MGLRPNLELTVMWSSGDGSLYTAYAQPWFPQALQHIPQVTSDRSMTVDQLADESGAWKVESLVEKFGCLGNEYYRSGQTPKARGILRQTDLPSKQKW